MRLNIYSQELTDEIEVVEKRSDTGITYSGVRLILHSSDRLHNDPGDDDRSAITIWLPASVDRRETLATTLENMALRVRGARLETGSDY